ncbi:MAG: ABC transporter ATP-binding protein [Pseudomonadota bacterium]|nr:ABC transporter ATP-binding protein [Pseudomonadota bacterium]
MIDLRGVERVFRMGDQSVHALRHVDLDVRPGEYISLMGPSGSGKSTLLNVLGLLDTPSDGNYRFEGTDIGSRSDDELAALRRERIGFVFQSFHLVARLTAAGNIALPMVISGIDPTRRRARVKELLARFDLTDRGEHKPSELSGGQRQRVAIARAVCLKPSLILADEPTGNLDSRSGDEVVAVLEELNHDGIALIVVTHDQDLGQRADRRIRMRDGAIVEDSGVA